MPVYPGRRFYWDYTYLFVDRNMAPIIVKEGMSGHLRTKLEEEESLGVGYLNPGEIKALLETVAPSFPSPFCSERCNACQYTSLPLFSELLATLLINQGRE